MLQYYCFERAKIMKLPNIKILEEHNKLLRMTSKEATFPLSHQELMLIDDMITYLTMSQIKETQQKYNLRAGWGMGEFEWRKGKGHGGEGNPAGEK